MKAEDLPRGSEFANVAEKGEDPPTIKVVVASKTQIGDLVSFASQYGIPAENCVEIVEEEVEDSDDEAKPKPKRNVAGSTASAGKKDAAAAGSTALKTTATGMHASKKESRPGASAPSSTNMQNVTPMVAKVKRASSVPKSGRAMATQTTSTQNVKPKAASTGEGNAPSLKRAKSWTNTQKNENVPNGSGNFENPNSVIGGGSPVETNLGTNNLRVVTGGPQPVARGNNTTDRNGAQAAAVAAATNAADRGGGAPQPARGSFKASTVASNENQENESNKPAAASERDTLGSGNGRGFRPRDNNETDTQEGPPPGQGKLFVPMSVLFMLLYTLHSIAHTTVALLLIVFSCCRRQCHHPARRQFDWKRNGNPCDPSCDPPSREGGRPVVSRGGCGFGFDRVPPEGCSRYQNASQS